MFPTSEKVYNRVKWDPSIDESRFTLLWRERDGRLIEVVFLDWHPGGRIP